MSCIFIRICMMEIDIKHKNSYGLLFYIDKEQETIHLLNVVFYLAFLTGFINIFNIIIISFKLFNIFKSKSQPI